MEPGQVWAMTLDRGWEDKNPWYYMTISYNFEDNSWNMLRLLASNHDEVGVQVKLDFNEQGMKFLRVA